jgi:hypothetical protein
MALLRKHRADRVARDALTRFCGRPDAYRVNAGIAVIVASLPLLHRLSPLAAPLVLTAFAFATIFRTSFRSAPAAARLCIV